MHVMNPLFFPPNSAVLNLRIVTLQVSLFEKGHGPFRFWVLCTTMEVRKTS